MLCHLCNKNPATIHIQEFVNGEKKTLHICAQCAASKALGDSAINPFNLAELIYNISEKMQFHDSAQDNSDGEESGPLKDISAIVCKNCGWTVEKMRENAGRLGCAECYKAFSDLIKPSLEKLHRGTMHVGKKPGNERSGSPQQMLEMLRLQKELQELVMREEYEMAADIRDKIHKLKEEMEKND